MRRFSVEGISHADIMTAINRQLTNGGVRASDAFELPDGGCIFIDLDTHHIFRYSPGHYYLKKETNEALKELTPHYTSELAKKALSMVQEMTSVSWEVSIVLSDYIDWSGELKRTNALPDEEPSAPVRENVNARIEELRSRAPSIVPKILRLVDERISVAVPQYLNIAERLYKQTYENNSEELVDSTLSKCLPRVVSVDVSMTRKIAKNYFLVEGRELQRSTMLIDANGFGFLYNSMHHDVKMYSPTNALLVKLTREAIERHWTFFKKRYELVLRRLDQLGSISGKSALASTFMRHLRPTLHYTTYSSFAVASDTPPPYVVRRFNIALKLLNQRHPTLVVTYGKRLQSFYEFHRQFGQ